MPKHVDVFGWIRILCHGNARCLTDQVIRMDSFLYFLVGGICIGVIYALIALGYTLVYGIIKLINFAHGEFYMVGAYAGLAVYTLLPPELSLFVSIPAILLAAGIAGALIAVLCERVAYRPIRSNGRLVALLTAIGVSFFLQNLFALVKNGNPLSYGGAVEDLCQQSIQIGGSGIKTVKFAFIIITAALMLVLWYVVMRTRFGRAMRATSQDMDAARLMGIDVDSVTMRTFALGGFFAGVAGALIGAQSVVEPMMGFMPGLIAFVAAVVGGIGSIPGAVLGGLLIGVLQQMVIWAGIPSGYKDVMAFLLLIVVLLIRPQGILGKPEIEKV